jgi:hypothetical protein
MLLKLECIDDYGIVDRNYLWLSCVILNCKLYG